MPKLSTFKNLIRWSGGGGGGDRRLKEKDDVRGGGGGGGDKREGDGGVGGGKVLFFLSFILLNLFLITKSTPGGPGGFFTRSPAVSFLPLSSFFTKDPTVGFSASKVDIFSNTSSSRFFLFKIFFFIGSSFCLILDPISCHVIVNVCLHSLCKITRCKYIFLGVIEWNISIVCNSPIEIKPRKLLTLFVKFLENLPT